MAADSSSCSGVFHGCERALSFPYRARHNHRFRCKRRVQVSLKMSRPFRAGALPHGGAPSSGGASRWWRWPPHLRGTGMKALALAALVLGVALLLLLLFRPLVRERIEARVSARTGL